MNSFVASNGFININDDITGDICSPGEYRYHRIVNHYDSITTVFINPDKHIKLHERYDSYSMTHIFNCI